MKGFTLLELMIVVALIAIIAAIGFPSYQNQVERGRVSEARTALVEAATSMERCYTARGSYVGCTPRPQESASGFYAIAVRGAAANTYELVATRQVQTGSNKCGRLVVNAAGTRTVESASWSVDQCWR
ncbi:MAG: methylation site containing protein [Alcanivorax sp.]|nr:methylation site containing protein [Alcanivorax sp.]